MGALRMNRQLLLSAILMTLSLHSSAFGTFLTSPAERASLDNMRQHNEANILPVQRVKTVEPNKTISFEGLVTRHKGPGSIWLNGKLIDEGAVVLPNSTHSKNIIAVSVPSAHGHVQLKPGQIIRPDSGELREVYQRQTTSLGDKQAALPGTEPALDNVPLTGDIH